MSRNANVASVSREWSIAKLMRRDMRTLNSTSESQSFIRAGRLARGRLASSSNRRDDLSGADEILAAHDHALTVLEAADPHRVLKVLDQLDRNERDLVAGMHNPYADLAGRRDRERRAWKLYRRHRLEREGDLGRDAVRNLVIGIGHLDFNPIGARCWARGLGDEADVAGVGLARDQPHFRAFADLDAAELALGDFNHRQHRIERDQRGKLRSRERERGAADLG